MTGRKKREGDVSDLRVFTHSNDQSGTVAMSLPNAPHK